ncbi:MAG TPA: hypothetical protein VGX25_04060 [Actinophytocola sp.]|uniref:hypothetical protein n=1 Tax=Actinophytocola sp. TaxID=1872138 RepID=UPI002DDCA439|nr:hypothetical protein [Actinophytocola sp.]HEV2778553.1 hypothetical protein [Actinophytocola sp.]
MRSWFLPARQTDGPELARGEEATAQQVLTTGAAAGAWHGDGIDEDRGWKPAGSAGRREVPFWTLEKARVYSVASYRSNPMARAIIDTYVSFCVGESGVSYQVTNPQVRAVVDEFWNDPRNNVGGTQELGLRSNLLLGETVREMLVGATSGVVRYSPMDPLAISEVSLFRNNPAWPAELHFHTGDGLSRSLPVVAVDDRTGLRAGKAMFWTPFKALETDVRSAPFLMPVLDWLDAYDTVISNLIDRTALARYMVWDVTVEGGQAEVDNFIAARGGTHVPPAGSVEVHNNAVTWDAKHVETGAYEDANAAKSVLTLVAGGAGLAKTWLAEPEDANRATSLSMAEPVRRRVAGVQSLWLGYQAEQLRFAVDRAVAARRLPATVDATDPRSGQTYQVPAAQSVLVTGPEIAAADAQITAQTLLNLSTGLERLVAIGALTEEAAAMAARKAWEDYVGVPYTAELDSPDTDRDEIATAVDDAATNKTNLRAV